ncbi:DNA polymerase Y family protein [Hyphomonas sp.]|uniref:Y-family DNA polymerase n=1 Tax=Hyphomonas sp. TaxID=87 RepID=UPI0025BF60F3|nr:DNA polymerase Y family protein [Hyphomonas sp.]
MRRYLSVWFPEWSLDRLRRVRRHPTDSLAERPAKARPFVLYEKSAHGLIVAATNEAARTSSLQPGLRLADARATLPDLTAEEVDRESDEESLKALASWLVRFSPLVALDGNDGLILEVTGCSHLFGGEACMAAELSLRLKAAGYGHRLAFAGTRGAAYALARGEALEDTPAILQSGSEQEGLENLPVSQLRLSDAAFTLLRRFGLTRIGQLYEIDRKALARRFHSREAADAVCMRLDQALGYRNEPFEPFRPPSDYIESLPCPEPLADSAGIHAGLTLLTGKLCRALDAAGLGAQSFVLRAFRSDGEVLTLRVNAALPVRTPDHVLRLFGDKAESIDPGFGIDLLQIEAFRTAAMTAGSRPLSGELAQNDIDETALAALADRINARLGEGSVTVTVPVARHPVDLAEETWPYAGKIMDGVLPAAGMKGLRPIRVFDRAERVEVMAQVPDGPPLSFVWRRVVRRVVRADGPERIAPEWWTYFPPRAGEAKSLPRARDYYRVEDADGRRYWVFREGIYGDRRGTAPDWFVQGLFA